MGGIMQTLIGSYSTAADVGPTPGSIYFPTTSSRVTLSPGITLSSTYQSPFTVEGWFYSGDTPGSDSGPVLLSTTTSDATPAYAKALTINVVSTTQIVVDSNGAAATTFNLAQTLVAAAWYYLAVSRDASGFMQVWLGKQGDASAAASTSGRFNCSVNTSAWALTGLSNCIGAFVPAGRYSATDYISGVRVTNTNLYTTTDATIEMPTETFGYISGILFLQSPDDNTDLTGNQTLTEVGSAAYSATGPSIEIQPYYSFYEAIGSTVAISTTQYVGDTKIYAYSSTYDVPSYQPAVVEVNDVEIVNTENRGHTMVVLSPSGATVSINSYDTYDAITGPANLTALANALNGVANGNRVVLVTYDASAFNAACRSALTTGYGDTNSNEWTATRFSQIFVGIKS